MAAEKQAAARVRVDGKFFRLGDSKFFVKGVTYGPFAPDANGNTFATPDRTRLDFQVIRQLGGNLVRVYYTPARWFLDLAEESGLKVFVDVPWAKHLCFLDSASSRREARRAVREAVTACRAHNAVFALSVVNEIPADIARWSGVRQVQRFLADLVDDARGIDSECLYTCASFPSTEFLQCENVDFACFNVYLHEPKSLQGYLARLQTLADSKPLVLGEFGMDAIRNGEQAQADFLSWQIETAFRCGAAGTIVFSFTDDWFRGGAAIEDWAFGLTRKDRSPKPAFEVVAAQYRSAPRFPLPAEPKVSVVVATYNGSRTLRACLESLSKLNYADYEVVVIDDGSTDATPEIARAFPFARYYRQNNQGLSAARNAGIRAATGQIVAFTDDDCRADENWLYYLVQDLTRGGYAGIGGHNLLPPEDSPVAAAIMAAPGGPAHVLLTDQEAEHIPGCNMAFYKTALEEVGLFDPLFRKAGDDVDLCWRLLDHNFKIGFSPAGFVWHYRRSTLKAYVRQQSGYGEAEALLIGKHPEHYNAFGGGRWQGRIYASSLPGLLLRRPVIYHGIFGSGFFQKIYAPNPVPPLMHSTSLAYQVFVNLPLLALALNFRAFVPMAVASMGITLGSCAIAGWQASIPRPKRRFWSRPLVALLFLLQPIARDWARFKSRLQFRPPQTPVLIKAPAPALDLPERLSFWSAGGVERLSFLTNLVRRLESSGWAFRIDTGWAPYDLEIVPWIWTRIRLTTVSEELAEGKRTLHCRLQSGWSLPARMLAAVLAAAIVVLIIGLREKLPWIWYSLVSLPLLWWIFEDGNRHFRNQVGALANAEALNLSLVEVQTEKSKSTKTVAADIGRRNTGSDST